MNLLSRRVFLKNSFLSSVIFVTYSGELFAAVTPQKTLSVLHKDIFPSSAKVPSSDLINGTFYLNTIILNHTCISVETKIYIRDGIKWLNEEAIKKYKKVYAKLPSSKREKVLRHIVDTTWGESWLDTIMTYFLEAVLGDPVYGVNGGQKGWKWLNHETGYPRPKKAFL
jgi:gluconate 2-dehydrogenase gamma chain